MLRHIINDLSRAENGAIFLEDRDKSSELYRDNSVNL